MTELEEIFEKLKRVPRLESATLMDVFAQRSKVYNEENCDSSVIIGIEISMLWKTIDELLKQLNDILATLKKEQQ